MKTFKILLMLISSLLLESGYAQNVSKLNENYFFKTFNLSDPCVIVFKITPDLLMYYRERKISKRRIHSLVKKHYQKCKSQSKTAFIADWIEDYNIPPDLSKFEQIAIDTITDLQEEMSLKKFGKSLDSITTKQWEGIQLIYPTDVHLYWCCKQ